VRNSFLKTRELRKGPERGEEDERNGVKFRGWERVETEKKNRG